MKKKLTVKENYITYDRRTWGEFDKVIDWMEIQIKAGSHNKTIYGIPRGGLSLAVALSNRMDYPMVMHPTPGCIILDDIMDSGETMAALVHRYMNRPNSCAGMALVWVVNAEKLELAEQRGIRYYSIKKSKDWVVFPMEK